MKDGQNYNILFSEIINGYSRLIHNSIGDIFLKHLSYTEISDLDVNYYKFIDIAKKNRFPIYKEREEQIIKDGSWKRGDEIELIEYEKLVQNLKISYSKEFLHSKRLIIKGQIESCNEGLNRLRIKKNYYIGKTAEQWANNKITEYKISNSLFLDDKFTKKIINDELLSEESHGELLDIYYSCEEKFNSDSIKKLSLSGFFTNIFYLCEDDVMSFYGKPVIKLTDYQVSLFTYARYFKNILSQRSDIPKELASNPDEIINWIELKTNAEKAKVFDEEEVSASSLIGATKDDYKRLGIETGSGNNKLNETLKKKGGVLRAEDLMNIEG